MENSEESQKPVFELIDLTEEETEERHIEESRTLLEGLVARRIALREERSKCLLEWNRAAENVRRYRRLLSDSVGEERVQEKRFQIAMNDTRRVNAAIEDLRTYLSRLSPPDPTVPETVVDEEKEEFTYTPLSKK